MRRLNVLISGAGIAGLQSSVWGRRGHSFVALCRAGVLGAREIVPTGEWQL